MIIFVTVSFYKFNIIHTVGIQEELNYIIIIIIYNLRTIFDKCACLIFKELCGNKKSI